MRASVSCVFIMVTPTTKRTTAKKMRRRMLRHDIFNVLSSMIMLVSRVVSIEMNNNGVNE